MDTECWVNRLPKHSPECVEVLPTPFGAVEHQSPPLIIQRYLNLQWRKSNFSQSHVTGGLAHCQLAVFPLQAPGHRVVTKTTVVTTTRDVLVTHTQRPHGFGTHFYHPNMLTAREPLAAQNLGCACKTLWVLHIRLLGGAVLDCAQIIGDYQAGVGSAEVEGEVQRVEEDMEGIQEAGHF